MARDADPIGHAIHTALAMAYLAGLSLGTSPKDVAWGALAVWTLIRAPRLWRSMLPILTDRVLLLWAAWTLWHAVTLLWSADRAAGLDELGASRVILTPLLLLPVIDRAGLLVGAYLAGVFAHNLVQGAQGLGWLGMMPDDDGRLSGLQHPILTGALCAAAACWHLSALLHWRPGPVPHQGATALPGHSRVVRHGWHGSAVQAVARGTAVSCGTAGPPAAGKPWHSLVLAATIIGLAAAGAGLVVSGSRGPWIAAAITVPACIAVIAWRRPATRRAAVILAVAGAAAAAAAWPVAGDFVLRRSSDAAGELRRAVDESRYDSSVGLRIARWSAALRIAREAPLFGVGIGGFCPAAAKISHGELPGADEHAHSMYLHELATAGIVGFALMSALMGILLVRAWRAPPDHRYADGTFFVLAGWLIGTLSDCYNLSGTTFGLFSFIVALMTTGRAGSIDDMRRHWDRFARSDPMFYIAARRAPWTPEEFFATGRELARDVLAWAGEGLGRRRMLDVGCGLGRAAVGFAPHFDRVDAIDISPVMIEKARRLGPPSNAHFAVTNGRDLREFPDGAFDFVLCVLVLQHVPDESVVASYLSEIGRLLASSGRAVVQVDTRPPTPASRLYERLPLGPGRTRGPFIRRYRRRREAIARLIDAAGLRIAGERDPGTAGHVVLLERLP